MKMSIRSRTKKIGLLLVAVLFLQTLLLSACSSGVGAPEAQKFLEFVNTGEQASANQYVCKEQQDGLINRLTDDTSMIEKDKDVLGMKSPGISNVQCQDKDGDVLCSFSVPTLICSGNLFEENANITCDAIDPVGKQVTILFIVKDGKFCNFSVQKSE
jgi:hypothetical protein